MNDRTKADTTEKKVMYRVLSEEILARIRAQDFSYDQPICTEKQLMERHGVSRITAQRAIDELVHAGVLYRVKGMGSFVVRADAPAAVDRPVPRQIFALVLPHVVEMKGMIHIVQALSRRLDESGHCLSIYIGEQNDPRCRSILARLTGLPVTGVVYYPLTGELPVEQLMQLTMRGIRVVIMDKPISISAFGTVVSDNEGGGTRMAEHLIGLGHRKIAYLATESLRSAPTLADRFVGLCKGLKAAGVDMAPQYLRTGLSRYGESPEEVQRALAAEVKGLYEAGATAIFCQNDIIAFYASNACRSLGLRVPEQLSLCGFDDSDYAQMADPQLTTVEQVDAELGDAAAKLLLTDAPEPGRIVVPVRLVARKSTGPVRSI